MIRSPGPHLPGLDEPKADPYPVHALPDVMREYIERVATVTSTLPEMSALPCLVGLGACIGRARRLAIPPFGYVYPFLWGSVVAYPGARKSVAYRIGVAPIEEIHDDIMDHLDHERAAYKAGWREGPQGPPKPKERRLIVRDIPLDVLRSRLSDNPRGLFLCRDELGAFFSYRALGRWLAGQGSPRPEPVSVFGTTRPADLVEIVARYGASGLLARFIFAAPAWTRSPWRDDGDDDAEDPGIFSRAWALHGLGLVEEEPVTLGLTDDALDAWNAERQAAAPTDDHGANSPLGETAARIALILALVSDPAATVVDGRAMRSGIEIARWHRGVAEYLFGVGVPMRSGSQKGARSRPEKQARVELVNQFVAFVASHGRRFFRDKETGRLAEIRLDDRGRAWWLDEYTQKSVYLHSKGRWRGFTHGGTLRDLVTGLRDFVCFGTPLKPSQLGPWPEWYSNADPWGYGLDDMKRVRNEAARLGLFGEDYFPDEVRLSNKGCPRYYVDPTADPEALPKRCGCPKGHLLVRRPGAAAQAREPCDGDRAVGSAPRARLTHRNMMLSWWRGQEERSVVPCAPGRGRGSPRARAAGREPGGGGATGARPWATCRRGSRRRVR